MEWWEEDEMTDDTLDDMYAQSVYETLLRSGAPEKLLKDLNDYFDVGRDGGFEKYPPAGYDTVLPDEFRVACEANGIEFLGPMQDPLSQIRANMVARLSACGLDSNLVEDALSGGDAESERFLKDSVMDYYEREDGLPFDKYVDYIATEQCQFTDRDYAIVLGKLSYERGQDGYDVDGRLDLVLNPDERDDFGHMFDAEKSVRCRFGRNLGDRLVQLQNGQVLDGVDVTRGVGKAVPEPEKSIEKAVQAEDSFQVPEFEDAQDEHDGLGG